MGHSAKYLFATLVVVAVVVMASTTATAQDTNHAHHHIDLYGKPCSNDSDVREQQNLAHCDLNRNMYCSETSLCDCIIGERGRKFEYYEKTCIEVATAENGFACSDNVQCTRSEYGRYSRCNMDYGRCQCWGGGDQNATLVGNVCYIQNMARARTPGGNFQSCSSNNDCTTSPLGRLSRCNQVSFTCECYDTVSSGKQETAPYDGKCVYKKKLDEFCNEDAECRAGYHHSAVCVDHPTYLRGEKVCACPQGRRCDDDAGGSGAFRMSQMQTHSMIWIGFTTVMMGAVATVIS